MSIIRKNLNSLELKDLEKWTVWTDEFFKNYIYIYDTEKAANEARKWKICNIICSPYLNLNVYEFNGHNDFAFNKVKGLINEYKIKLYKEQPRWNLNSFKNYKLQKCNKNLDIAIGEISKQIGKILLTELNITSIKSIVDQLNIKLSSSIYHETNHDFECKKIKDNSGNVIYMVLKYNICMSEIQRSAACFVLKPCCNCYLKKVNVNINIGLLGPANKKAEAICNKVMNTGANEVLDDILNFIKL